MKTIIVRIKGGLVIDVQNLPDNTELEIRDYDIQETEEDRTFNDEYGDYEADCYYGKETE